MTVPMRNARVIALPSPRPTSSWSDEVPDRPAFAQGYQVRHEIARVLRAGAARAAAEMGRKQDVLETQQRVVVRDRFVEEHVEPRSRDPARRERLHQGVFVDNPAPAGC